MTENVVSFQPGAGALTEPMSEAPLSTTLSDLEFSKVLTRLRQIASYLTQLDIDVDTKVHEAARLGPLNLLKDAYPKKGRLATGKEWDEAEIRTQIIWAALTSQQRRKFLATEIPGWFSYLVFVLMFVAISSIFAAFLITTGVLHGVSGNLLGPFMVWIGALGAIGACASIGMNALSVQDDVTFDLSSSKFLWLRVVLGALFGTVLTLPLGFVGFQQFLTALEASSGTGFDTTAAVKQASLLLLPFILGYSTSVVILVLNRFVESVQTFFGKTNNRTNAADHPAMLPPPKSR